MPGYNIYFFTPELLNHVLNTAAFHADTGADRVYIRIV